MFKAAIICISQYYDKFIIIIVIHKYGFLIYKCNFGNAISIVNGHCRDISAFHVNNVDIINKYSGLC